MAGPLAGVRIVELATTLMAPYACQLLGDLGASIIKIEDAAGDPNRTMGGGGTRQLSGTALNLHRNKKSIALDLKAEAGRQIARQLLARSDVLVTNMRPNALVRLGMDYETVRAIRPDIIYAEAHGFRSDTGLASAPSYDDTIQALTGLPMLNEAVGAGVLFPPTLIADKISGHRIFEGVLAALFHRERTGAGQRVEIPMFDSVLAFVLAEHLAQAAQAGGQPGYSRILTANRGPHRTSDGWLAVMPYLDRHWEALFTEAGCADLLESPWHADMRTRLMQADIVYGELKSVLGKRSTDDWMEICTRLDVPAARVLSLSEIVENPDLHHGVLTDAEHPVVGQYRQIAQPILFAASPTSPVAGPAPLIGQDGPALLRDLGYSDGEVEHLINSAVVGVPSENGTQPA